jgi:UDP-2,3-diacylglucosamine hydrolase
MPHTLFISDLHLCPTRPRINQLFFAFLRQQAIGAEALYVLGDLFEYWAGDDDIGDPFNQSVVQAFRTLSDHGVPLFFIHGNRDFLIGKDFAEASGMTLLTDPSLVDIHGSPTLLMHGDSLCTDDTNYMEFRAKVRDPEWQTSFLAQPLAQRKKLIEGLREESRAAQTAKPTAIMDVSPDTVIHAFEAYGCPRLIHGHTHRPGHHMVPAADHLCERWVLPDWYESGGYLACDAQGCELHTLK